jgi:hypothetical protein
LGTWVNPAGTAPAGVSRLRFAAVSGSHL